METIDLGETYLIVTGWWDEETLIGVEPSAIALTVTAPDGSTQELTKADMTGSESVDGSGTDDVWTYPQVVDQTGIWQWTAHGTLPDDVVTRSALFLVGASEFGVAPCEPWTRWENVLAVCGTADLSSIEPGVRAHLIDVATGILWSLDGRRYPGICTTTRRICRSCTACVTSPCCCSNRMAIDLGSRWPALGILDVTIEGETLAPSAYALRGQRYVDRLDGELWPVCARLTDPDAFTMTWALGLRPPVELADAAAVFVAEMAKSCAGQKCEIPQRVSVITREGTTYTILDSQKFINEGRTGIYRVDLALAAAKTGRKVRPGGRAPFRPGQRTSRV